MKVFIIPELTTPQNPNLNYAHTRIEKVPIVAAVAAAATAATA